MTTPTSEFWKGRKVVVTGGAGFLGSFIVERLTGAGAEVSVPRKRDYNFVDFGACMKCLAEARARTVIHCAAFYGGIWINQVHPGRIYYENLLMGANLMEASRLSAVEKFVGIGTACSYPGYLGGYLPEEKLWDGPLHESVENYGLTKKCMVAQGKAYRKEYGFPSIHLILTNLYGPRDTFNPLRSHVVSALIRKFVEAAQQGAEEVEVWGTGKPVREFLYVEDCAEGVVRAAELYDSPVPLNVGTGKGTSIKELAEAIADVTGFKGRLRWNAEKPDGQEFKVLDVSRMKQELSWEPAASLRDGLRKTIDWYAANQAAADERF